MLPNKVTVHLGFLIVLTMVAMVPVSAKAQVPSSAQTGNVTRQLQEKPVFPEKMREGVMTIPEQDLRVPGNDKKVFTLTGIMLSGASVFTADDLSFAYDDFLNQQVSFANLETIANRITRHYRRSGYALSYAVLPAQKIKEGRVRLDIVEGYVSKVSFLGADNLPDRELRRYLDDVVAAKPLSMPLLERALMLLNDLPGIEARGILQPASVMAGTELVVTINREKQDARLSLDNRGSRYLGRTRVIAEGGLNSVLAGFDRLSVRGLVTSDTDELRMAEAYYQYPLSTDGAVLTIGGGVTRTEPGARLSSADIQGDSSFFDVGVAVPVIRSRRYSLSFKAGLESLNTDTDIAGIGLSNDRIRSFKTGVVFDGLDPFYGSNRVVLDVVKGINGLGATDDGAGRSRANGKHDFWRIEGSFVRLQQITTAFSFYTAIAGQYAWDPLLSAEEFGVGGVTFGRAYDPSEISGDHGLTGLIEVRYNIDWPKMPKTKLQAYGFYDAGVVWNKGQVVADPEKESLASAGAGLRFNLPNHMDGGIELAMPLTRRVEAEGSDGDDVRVFFNLSKGF